MDRGLVRHAHPHCHVLLKVEGDDTQFLVGDRTVSLTGDQAVLVNAWEPHAYVHDPRRDKAVILALYIEPAWLGGFRRNWMASATPGFFAAPAGLVTRSISRYARDLAAEMIYAPESSRIQNELIGGLMVAVLEHFTDWHDVTPSLRCLAARNGSDRRVWGAITRMINAPNEASDVAGLARAAGLSRAHFYRLFEQSTGSTPHLFLNGIRVERAVEAIVAGSRTLGDIGAGLGFAEPAHFSRFFRDHAGVSPSAFRARVHRARRPAVVF